VSTDHFTRRSKYDVQGPRSGWSNLTLDIGHWTLDFLHSVANSAINAGIVSHSNPFNRKNMNPQKPNLLIQLRALTVVG